MRRGAASRLIATAALVTGTLAGAKGCTPGFRECAPIRSSNLAALPPSLSDTGLFRDMTSEALGEGVRPFTPRFELWSDGAQKRRWIFLPRGSKIDTSDPDNWIFPSGTKLWKEFSRDGVRVETRMLYKHGAAPDAWTPIAYVWTNGGDAEATPEGMPNASGTGHDVPAAAECIGCHGGTPSGVLGFSFIQLPERGEGGAVGLDTLQNEELASEPLPTSNALPGTAATQAALGYLQANCAHCHNQSGARAAEPRCFDPRSKLDLALQSGDLERPEATATYRTAIGRYVVAGDTEESEIVMRAESRDPWWGMPALGTEAVHEDGVAVLKSWIRELP
jgi:hypothetical protein